MVGMITGEKKYVSLIKRRARKSGFVHRQALDVDPTPGNPGLRIVTF